MIRSSLFSALASITLVSVGIAGDYLDAGAAKNPVDVVPPTVSDFESNVWIDGWIVQLDVGLTDTALGFTESVFIGFDEIISNVDWIVPIGADLRYKRVGFMPDLVAMKMSEGSTFSGRFYDRANFDLEFGMLNLPAYIRVIDEPNTSVDLLGGARYLWVDFDVTLSGGPVGSALGSAFAGTDLQLWDGIVGLRLEHHFTEKLFCNIYGDVGTGSSDLTWQLLPSIGYRLSEKLSVAAGYRYLHYDLSEGVADADMTASGVQLTLNYKF